MSSNLAEVARRTDRVVDQARSELVSAVRAASAGGITQAEIAAEIGRSQPEVSRLLRFHGTSPLGRRLRDHAREIRRLVANLGGSKVRVFGSIATEQDHEGSDVDLLFTMGKPLSLLQLGDLESRISQTLGVAVDLVPDSALRPNIRDRVLGEAVAL